MAYATNEFHSKVVGTTFYQFNWDDITPATPLRIERDPGNVHDANAIKVLALTQSGWIHIGHLSRDIAAQFAPLIDKGQMSVTVTISEKTCHMGSTGPRYGLNIRIETQVTGFDFTKNLNPFLGPDDMRTFLQEADLYS